ncbi:MAG: NAD-dependent epimerase/dehydratase family protein [Acidimicrobiia bacterium]|nr:NAD-dependent epimerase/dehydratase family protein [Acidimicrobiia bacterium]
MSVLVTGGTGVVGGAVVRHLVATGRRVRGLSRTADGDRTLAALGAEPVRGDVLDETTLAAAVSGSEVVYHLAGVNAFCVDPAPMMRANIDGSRAVVAACLDGGVRRLVYTSSAATLGEVAGTIGHERSQHRGSYLSAYERSKHLAEEAVFAAARPPLEVVAVNPSSVQGPGRATGTGKVILDLINGKLPAVVRTRFSIVDIEDCARGHLLAEQRGVPGERYILSGFTLTMQEAVAILSAALGREITVRYAPGMVAMAGAAAVEAVARLRGRKPKVCREMVRTMLHGHAYDGSRATDELGLVYTPARETVDRLIAWFRAEGLINR